MGELNVVEFSHLAPKTVHWASLERKRETDRIRLGAVCCACFQMCRKDCVCLCVCGGGCPFSVW